MLNYQQLRTDKFNQIMNSNALKKQSKMKVQTSFGQLSPSYGFSDKRGGGIINFSRQLSIDEAVELIEHGGEIDRVDGLQALYLCGALPNMPEYERLFKKYKRRGIINDDGDIDTDRLLLSL